jgi:dephospho-CoA kinase
VLNDNAFSPNETLSALKAIFEKHRNERICVVGTMCCGKTTLINQLKEYNCIDMDDTFWPLASGQEVEFYSQRPFTKAMNDSLFKLFYKRITAKPDFPLFGVYILDCEVVVYLDIAESLLKEYCEKRGDTDFIDASNLKKWLEDDLDSHKIKNDKAFYYLTLKT